MSSCSILIQIDQKTVQSKIKFLKHYSNMYLPSFLYHFTIVPSVMVGDNDGMSILISAEIISIINEFHVN